MKRKKQLVALQHLKSLRSDIARLRLARAHNDQRLSETRLRAGQRRANVAAKVAENYLSDEIAENPSVAGRNAAAFFVSLALERFRKQLDAENATSRLEVLSASKELMASECSRHADELLRVSRANGLFCDQAAKMAECDRRKHDDFVDEEAIELAVSGARAQ